MTTQTIDSDIADALAARLLTASVGTMDILSIYIGDRLGLYTALEQHGPQTPQRLADLTGIHPRYAREWLEQQAATALLDVDNVAAEPNERSYGVSPSHATALTDPESPYSMAPLARQLVALTQALPQLLQAFKTGGGVDWAAFGSDVVEAQDDFHRPWIMNELPNAYLPAIPDVHQRLRAGARVAEFACGLGWASIAIGKAYPDTTVEGFDVDEVSIRLAEGFAAERGLASRVRFHQRDISDPALSGSYDLVLIIESLHDLARPIETLQSIRRVLNPGGVAILADERTADAFSAPASEIERLFYGFSVLCCLPASMTEQPSTATGTVIRAATVEHYARQAGFTSVRELTVIDHPMLRFYRLEG